MNPTATVVGPRVRALRVALGMTQAAFAEAAGLPRTDIARVENGHNAATSHAMRLAIADAADLSAGQLDAYLVGTVSLDDLVGPVGTPTMTFGDRVAQARRKAGLTMAALTRSAFLSVGTVSRIEANKTSERQGPETIDRLAHALGVRRDWLVYGHGEMSAAGGAS